MAKAGKKTVKKESFDKKLGDHFYRHGDYISSMTQAEHRIFEFLSKNKIHPDTLFIDNLLSKALNT